MWPIPALARALDILFILHADHEHELQHQRHEVSEQLAGRSVSLGCIGGLGFWRGRLHGRSQRRGSEHARRDRIQRSRPGLYQAGERRADQADGLRTSHLQELRSARQDHPLERRVRSSRLQGAVPNSTSRSNSSASPWKMTIS